MSFRITSLDKIIDLDAVKAGCQTILTASEDYTKCANLIKEAASTCSAEALSVDKTTMQPSLEELAVSVEQVKANIASFVDSIQQVASQIHYAQYTEYQNYLAYLDEQSQHRQHAGGYYKGRCR